MYKYGLIAYSAIFISLVGVFMFKGYLGCDMLLYSFPRFKIIHPLDLYGRNPTGLICQRLVNGINQPNVFAFNKTSFVGFSVIVSSGGTAYTLWDNSNCSTGGGGSQVAFD